MNKDKLKAISEDLIDLFHGMMFGDISYSYDKLHTAMGMCIGEVFDSIAGEFCSSVMNRNEITNEQLQTLRTDLVAFKDEFSVDEVDSIIEKIDAL